ncbi:MAG: phosphate ABC transporter substrate-binding protein PstS [Rhodospirillales bacterium]|nr:phosphate ABC transporter substrate-binding protein PstS [Rhodospirillales bacterium]
MRFYMNALSRYAVRGMAIAAAAVLWTGAASAQISGAGATFPYPLYAKWAEAYRAKTGIALNYQSIGSGGGIKQITSKTVDFGASDMPLKPDELAKAGLVQFPTVMGGVVPVVNIAGVKPGELKLTGKVLADIYLGKIKTWNDPAIASLNPGLKLPSQAIAVIHRSDGSGTTFIFADYLAKVSPEWGDKVGVNTSLQWPVGFGGKGNEGVAALTSRAGGAIGYVEYAYAKQNKMTHVLLANRAGDFVAPDSTSFQSAAANADWEKAPGYYLLLTDQPGKGSWPITGATFILMHANAEKPEIVKQVLQFFDWSYRHGDKLAEGLDYVPMPDKVVGLIEHTWKQIKDANGQPVWTGPVM